MRWSGTRSRGFVALVIALVVAAPVGPVAAASPPYLAENLRPGEGSEPAEFVGSSEMVYFTAGDPEHGREVWRTDGTPEGTSLVADIHPGPEGSEPFGLVEYQDGILFAASDDQGPAIWRASGELVGATVVARTTIDAKWDSAPPPIVAGDRIFVTGDTTSGLRLMQVDQATGALRSVGDIGERVH